MYEKFEMLCYKFLDAAYLGNNYQINIKMKLESNVFLIATLYKSENPTFQANKLTIILFLAFRLRAKCLKTRTWEPERTSPKWHICSPMDHRQEDAIKPFLVRIQNLNFIMCLFS